MERCFEPPTICKTDNFCVRGPADGTQDGAQIKKEAQGYERETCIGEQLKNLQKGFKEEWQSSQSDGVLPDKDRKCCKWHLLQGASTNAGGNACKTRFDCQNVFCVAAIISKNDKKSRRELLVLARVELLSNEKALLASLGSVTQDGYDKMEKLELHIAHRDGKNMLGRRMLIFFMDWLFTNIVSRTKRRLIQTQRHCQNCTKGLRHQSHCLL